VGKGKKKSKKHSSFHNAIKPFTKDSRVLYTVFGALGAGVVLGAALGAEKGSNLVERLTSAVKQLGQPHEVPEEKSKPAKQIKSPKPFATES
jgi:hypothetical protein